MFNRKRVACAALFAVVLLVAGCTAKMNAVTKASEQPLQANEETTLETTFRQVKVSSDVPSIHIGLSPDETTRLSIRTSDPEKLQKHFDFHYRETDGQLEVTVRGKSRNPGLDVLDLIETWGAELHVELPDHSYNSVTVHSDVGKIEYREVNADRLAVSSEVGTITVADTATEQAIVTNSVGAVRLDNVNGKTEVSNSTGTVNIYVPSIENDIAVKTELGAVTIETDREPDNVRLDLSTEIGKVGTNFDIERNDQSKRSIAGQKGENGPQIKVRSEIGPIEVRYRE